MIDSAVKAISDGLAPLEGVFSIGLSSNPLPRRRQDGDIDLFVYCSEIPSPSERAVAYANSSIDPGSLKPRIFVSDRWGDCDYLGIAGIDTWIMYFRIAEAKRELSAISEGLEFERDNGFYPSGRLAMFRNFTILLDRNGFLSEVKRSLERYPEKLRSALIEHCIASLGDEEDLLRALERCDVLFYHVSIDEALDSLLQLTYALNRVLFPSRKRVEEHLETFTLKPDRMHARILEIIELGARKADLPASHARYRELRDEVIGMAGRAT